MRYGFKKKKNKLTPFSFIANLVLFAFSISCVFPAIWMFYSSMKTKAEFNIAPLALPKNLDFGNYIYIFTKTDIWIWLGNSIRNALLALIFIIFFGFVIGYFLARYKFKGRNAIYTYFLLGMLIPIHALMVPIYILFYKTGLGDSWYTLLFPNVAFGLPTAIFLIETYVKTIPREIEEAAAMDGSNFTKNMFLIIFPICTPILATVAIIQFFGVWNDFLFPLVLINTESLKTVPVGLTIFKGQYATEYPRMIAGMFIAVMPAMCLYFIFSKYVTKGMVVGSVKG